MPAAVPVLERDGAADLSTAAETFDVDIALLESAGATSAAGEVRVIPLRDGRLRWTVRAGTVEPEQWRSAGAGLARTIRDRLESDFDEDGDPQDLGDALDAEYVQVRLPEGAGQDLVTALTLGLGLGAYQFRVTGKPRPPLLRRALLVTQGDGDT